MNTDTELVLTSELLQSADDTVFEQKSDLGFHFGRGNAKNRYSKRRDYGGGGRGRLSNQEDFKRCFELGKWLR